MRLDNETLAQIATAYSGTYSTSGATNTASGSGSSATLSTNSSSKVFETEKNIYSNGTYTGDCWAQWNQYWTSKSKLGTETRQVKVTETFTETETLFTASTTETISLTIMNGPFVVATGVTTLTRTSGWDKTTSDPHTAPPTTPDLGPLVPYATVTNTRTDLRYDRHRDPTEPERLRDAGLHSLGFCASVSRSLVGIS